MRLFITGHQGYIGSVLTAQALARGHSVTGLDKGFYCTPLVEEATEGATTLRSDLSGVCPDLVNGHDWCFHLAAISNDPSAELSEEHTHRVNVASTRKVAVACAATETPLIFASTASVYGAVEDERSREDSRPNPISIYGRSKVAAEEVLRELAASAGLRCIILRQATVFGWSPRMRYDLVVNTALLSALRTGKLIAHGGGECWRPLVYIGDVAKVWLGLAEHATPDWWAAQDGCPTFNVCHHEKGRTKNYRISELLWWISLLLRDRDIPCELVRDMMQSPDQRDYKLDASRLQHAGHICPTGITPALEEMLEHIWAGECADFDNPIYRNHEWMLLLQQAKAKAEEWAVIP